MSCLTYNTLVKLNGRQIITIIDTPKLFHSTLAAEKPESVSY